MLLKQPQIVLKLVVMVVLEAEELVKVMERREMEQQVKEMMVEQDKVEELLHLVVVVEQEQLVQLVLVDKRALVVLV